MRPISRSLRKTSAPGGSEVIEIVRSTQPVSVAKSKGAKAIWKNILKCLFMSVIVCAGYDVG